MSKKDEAVLLGERLRAVRKSLGLTREEMASKLSISDRSLYNYERGSRSPSAEVLLSMVKRFMVSPFWLLTGQGTMLLSEEFRPTQRKAREKDYPQIVSKQENPQLYRLVTVLKESRPKEITRFMKMAFSYFGEEKKR